jgi:hypothetical protein
LSPLPSDSVHGTAAAYGWYGENVSPSLLSRTEATPVPSSASLALRFTVTFCVAVEAAPPLIVTVPDGLVVSSQVNSSDHPAREWTSAGVSS